MQTFNVGVVPCPAPGLVIATSTHAAHATSMLSLATNILLVQLSII
jgi:hypothetical protein